MGKPRRTSAKGGKVEKRREDKRQEHSRQEDTSEISQMASLSLHSDEEEVP
jgi:hypothetical protein